MTPTEKKDCFCEKLGRFFKKRGLFSSSLLPEESCLIFWTNTAYYFCLNPFRLRLEEDGDNSESFTYVAKKCWLQNALCLGIHVMAMSVYVLELAALTQLVTKDNHNPIDFLNVILKVTSIAYHVLLVYVIWTRSDKFAAVLNHIRTTSLITEKSKQAKPNTFHTCVVWISCHIYFCMVVLVGSLTIPGFHKRLHLRVTPDLNEPRDLSWNVIVLVLARLTAFSRKLMGFASDGLVLMTCLILWFPANRFATRLRNFMGVEDLPSILGDYEDIKVLSGRLNEAASLLILGFVLEGIPLYSLSAKTIITMAIRSSGIFLTFFFLSFCTIVFVASDAFKNVQMLKEILMKPAVQAEISNSKATLLLQELKCESVGMTGCGMFVVNFKLAAGVLSLMMTYFVVTVQFQNNYHT